MVLKAPWTPPLLRGPLSWLAEREQSVKDGVLALVLTLLAFVPTLSHIGAQIGDLPERPSDALSIGLTLAQTLPLTVRIRWPAACLSFVGCAFAVHQALGCPTTFGSVGLYLALYSAGAHQVSFRRTPAAVASAGYAVLTVVLHRLGSPQQIPDYLAFYLILAAVWMVGSVMRRRRAEEAERRRLAAEVAAAAERARIARELHDVVTHHVTAMVVQADAAQFLLTSAPERAGEGLAAVSGTGRRALTELRYLLGVLEATGQSASADPAPADRAPTLGKMGDLVEQARMSDQPVEFTERGERRPQSVDVELAAYRVVQEALTNAMRHAAGQRTQVLVQHGEEHIEIEVATEGPSPSPAAAPATRKPDPAGGRGLAGLRERVRMLDGELVAGPRPEGGFRVRAVIPTQPVQE
ncbi:sensor histidine kinase [Streptomyces sp. Ncost-T10-10d]|uniref:sensor histidine kinase n=1 Tax=Streptomyces sp. Ncost-T10-10d TaxID=1839774 RepID=UPI00081EA7AC|nr:Histidine kinase-like ATPase domain-containing protein [Streptomyces sp. Ncost-T10-10d]